MEHYGLAEHRLIQEAHARQLTSGNPRDLEDYRSTFNNLLVQLALLDPNEGREGRYRY
jgi:hypothetical protein